MGVVFQAEDAGLHRQVALKVLRPRLQDDASARQRFLREARAAAGLAHDHIMPILHIGEDGGMPYLVMPLLVGETLEQRLKREPRLSVPEVLRIGGEIAVGLAAAHERGFIHRDIKPSNIWLEGPPACGLAANPQATARVKLLDFGLARLLGSDATLTHSGAIVGTPAYMAPEQARGDALDARCDLFSLGCVMYRMTTGGVPFPGATTMATLRALELVTPKPPHVLQRAVPRGLSDLIVQLLAKRPEQRLPSARAVTAALEAVRDGRPVRSSAGRRRRRVGWAAALVGVCVLAGLWFHALGPRDGSTGDVLEEGAAVLFAPAVHYKSGLYPCCVAVGDFNGDGKLDLAVANVQSHQVSVVLGQGDGTFGDPIPSSAGEWFAKSVTAGDFNGDGKLDLVVANQGSHTISVLLGKGDGTFHAPVQYAVGTGPVYVVAGDFNGDGKPDLAVATGSGNVSVLLGKGDGTFHEAARRYRRHELHLDRGGGLRRRWQARSRRHQSPGPLRSCPPGQGRRHLRARGSRRGVGPCLWLGGGRLQR